MCRIKDWLDASNEQYLLKMPLHERDQMEAAARTWGGTLRQVSKTLLMPWRAR